MALPNDKVEMEEGSEDAPRGGSRLTIWLILLGIGLLFIPLYLIGATIKEGGVQIQSTLDVVEATLAYTPPPNPTAEALSGTLVFMRQQSESLKGLQTTLLGVHINWPSVIANIAAYDPEHMSISSVTQTATSITIGGKAAAQSYVTAYADKLRASGLFDQVAVGSITIETLPTATPTRTPTPLPNTTATFTPEPTLMVEIQSFANFQITITMKTKAS